MGLLLACASNAAKPHETGLVGERGAQIWIDDAAAELVSQIEEAPTHGDLDADRTQALRKAALEALREAGETPQYVGDRGSP